MEIIKDFLPEDMFKEFYDVYTGYNRVRWAYHNQANSESSDLGNFQFINLLYDARFEGMEVDVQNLSDNDLGLVCFVFFYLHCYKIQTPILQEYLLMIIFCCLRIGNKFL